MLHEFAGDSTGQWKAKRWEIDIFDNHKVALRREWIALEQGGEADRLVEGIGNGGMDEWVDLMYRILRKERNVVQDQTAKL